MSGAPKPPSVRRIALETLLEITQQGGYANLKLKELRHRFGTELSEQQFAWICAAVYGTMEHLLYVEYMLAQFTELRRQKPALRGILRMGAHELLFMRARPDVACNEAVKLTKEVGKGALAGYVNGVLRALARRLEDLPPLPTAPLQRLSVQYSWPEWLVKEWLSRFGEEEAEALLRAMSAEGGMALRAHSPYTTQELKSWLAEKHIAYRDGVLVPDCLHLESGLNIAEEPLFREGKLSVQGEGAMLAVHACGVRPGMRVLDACAAPGGKTAYLSALGGGDLRLEAWEKHAHRAELLQKTCARLHVPVLIKERDAAVLAPEYNDSFDVVLLDVPCSGLGTAGAKPDIRYGKGPEDILALAETQKGILEACAEYVRPGGALVYASCTISKKENEEQVAAFLARHSAYRLESLAPFLPAPVESAEEGMLQLLPHKHRTEGFFVARLKKEGGTPSVKHSV